MSECLSDIDLALTLFLRLDQKAVFRKFQLLSIYLFINLSINPPHATGCVFIKAYLFAVDQTTTNQLFCPQIQQSIQSNRSFYKQIFNIQRSILSFYPTFI